MDDDLADTPSERWKRAALRLFAFYPGNGTLDVRPAGRDRLSRPLARIRLGPSRWFLRSSPTFSKSMITDRRSTTATPSTAPPSAQSVGTLRPRLPGGASLRSVGDRAPRPVTAARRRSPPRPRTSTASTSGSDESHGTIGYREVFSDEASRGRGRRGDRRTHRGRGPAPPGLAGHRVRAGARPDRRRRRDRAGPQRPARLRRHRLRRHPRQWAAPSPPRWACAARTGAG